MRNLAIRTVTALLGAFLLFGTAQAQQAVLQGGNWVIGHVPIYSNSTSSYPVIVDSGVAPGIVSTGTLGQAAYYAAAGSTLSGTSALILSGTTAVLSPSGVLTLNPGSSGSINNMTIGGSAPLSGIFTTLQATTSLQLPGSAALTSTAGNGTKLGTVSGTLTTGNCVSIGSGSNFIDAGAPCVIGGGGTVNAGTTGQISYYATSGTTVSGLATGNNGVLVTNSGGNPSISSTLPSGLSIASPTFSGTVAGANTVPLSILAQIGTNTVLGNSTSGTANVTALSVGGCSSGTSALIWTTNTGFGCNTAINAASLGGATFSVPGAIGGGTPSAGTFTALVANTSFILNGSSTVTSLAGNGTKIGTAAGTLTNGHCVSIDAGGNFIDAGGACTTGGGGGTVASGTSGQATYYTGTGTVVGGTSAITLSGTVATIAPSSASTMDNVAIGGTTALAGKFTTVNATTSLTLNGSTALTSATGTGAKLVTSTGSQTNGNCVKIDASGNHIDAGAACATGSGLTWTDAPKTTNFTAVVNTAYCIDTATTGALTMTLPASPSAGDKVQFLDCKGNLAAAALTVARNGNKLMNLTEDMTVNTAYAGAIFTYDATLTDWRM